MSSDFVSLSRSGCYGTCPSYQVKVHANGNVEWEGGSFVKDRGKTRWSVAGPAASALVQRFRLTDVWSLCDDFSQSITDNAAVQIEIHVGSRLKRITDYANSSPLWFQGLIRLIDEVADTHRARHGSPKSEPFANIEHEYLPKPDMTDLMKAAGRGDEAQVRAILKTGGDLQAVDASGWSALMFAATHDDGSLVEMLLSAGADAKYLSPNGDTALMAAALRGTFDDDLAEAGRNINSQNRDGVAVLMLLACRPHSDELNRAIKAGARTDLRDNQRRTALDYLNSANCHRDPVRGRIAAWETTGPLCNAFDPKEYQAAKRLLSRSKYQAQVNQAEP